MLSRKEDETLKQYQVRICTDKNKLGLSWNEVAKILNQESGDSYGESKYRKWFCAYLEGYQDAIEESMSENDYLNEIQDQILELKKEKIKLQDQRREYMNLVKNEARFEHIQSEIIKAVRELKREKPLTWNRNDYLLSSSSTEAGIILSDWHKGLFARNYWNNFDDNEFDKRVEKLITKTIKYCRIHSVNTLHVFSIGDLVNGLIHVTTRINATEDVVSQTMSVAEKLCEVLLELSKYIKNIKYYHCRGNHDRVTANKNDEIAKESFADIIMWYLKARLSHVPNIEFMKNYYDDEIINAYICNKKIFAVHGHRDKPSEVIQNLSLMTKVVPDFVFMGHYHHHHEKEVHGSKVIVNSSLSGVDSYAKEIRRTSNPAQKLLVFEQEEGLLCTYDIQLN